MTGGVLRNVGLQSKTRLCFLIVIELIRDGNGDNHWLHSGSLRDVPENKMDLFPPYAM